jgi:hypothetical protein
MGAGAGSGVEVSSAASIASRIVVGSAMVLPVAELMDRALYVASRERAALGVEALTLFLGLGPGVLEVVHGRQVVGPHVLAVLAARADVVALAPS